MSKLQQAYSFQRRKDTGTYILSLNPVSGLPESICREWQRKSYGHFPDCLAPYRNPKNDTMAKNGAIALISFLKNQWQAGTSTVSTETVKVGHWLERFISLEDNPRVARIMGEGSPYSKNTIYDYKKKYIRYIKEDLFGETHLIG